MTRYSIPCKHEQDLVPKTQTVKTQTVNDYYPLSKQEIAVLLQIAKESEEGSTITDIQSRLCQGIIGLVCPCKREGPVANAQKKLENIYAENYHKGADPDLVDELYEIMQVK